MLETTPLATECLVLRLLCILVLYMLLPREGYSTNCCTVINCSCTIINVTESLSMLSSQFTGMANFHSIFQFQFSFSQKLFSDCHIFRQDNLITYRGRFPNPKNYMSVPSISDLWESYQTSHVAAASVNETHTSHKFSFSFGEQWASNFFITSYSFLSSSGWSNTNVLNARGPATISSNAIFRSSGLISNPIAEMYSSNCCHVAFHNCPWRNVINLSNQSWYHVMFIPFSTMTHCCDEHLACASHFIFPPHVPVIT